MSEIKKVAAVGREVWSDLDRILVWPKDKILLPYLVTHFNHGWFILYFLGLGLLIGQDRLLKRFDFSTLDTLAVLVLELFGFFFFWL